MLRKKSRGQSTLEYGLIIAAVVAALLAINYYMKRGIQGKLKESTDEIGRQFESDTFTTSWQTQSTGTTTTEEERNIGVTAPDGTTTSTITSSEEVTRSEHETWGTTPAQHY